MEANRSLRGAPNPSLPGTPEVSVSTQAEIGNREEGGPTVSALAMFPISADVKVIPGPDAGRAMLRNMGSVGFFGDNNLLPYYGYS